MRSLRMITDAQFDTMGVAIGDVASIKATLSESSRINTEIHQVPLENGYLLNLKGVHSYKYCG